MIHTRTYLHLRDCNFSLFLGIQDMAIVFTAGGEKGGIKGVFGVEIVGRDSTRDWYYYQFLVFIVFMNYFFNALSFFLISILVFFIFQRLTDSTYLNGPNSNTHLFLCFFSCYLLGSVYSFDYNDWKKIVKIMQQNEKIRIIPKRIETNTAKIISPLGLKFGEKTNIEVANIRNNYLAEIKKFYNLNLIKSYLLENEIFLTIDCMNTPISNYLLPILAEIGLDDSCLLNRKYTADFSGKTPTPNLGMRFLSV